MQDAAGGSTDPEPMTRVSCLIAVVEYGGACSRLRAPAAVSSPFASGQRTSTSGARGNLRTARSCVPYPHDWTAPHPGGTLGAYGEAQAPSVPGPGPGSRPS